MAKHREVTGYTEKHHIIPESLGGTNDRDNLVELSAREHFICHWLLVKMVDGEARSKMLYALHGMKAENRFQERYHTKITARVYEKYRIEHAANHSKTMKGRAAPNKGIPMSGEQKQKLRIAATGKKHSAETIAKRSATMRGTNRSEETKLKMSLAAKGKPKGPMSEEQKLKRSLKQTGVPKPKGFAEQCASRMKLEFTKNNPNQREDLQKICPHCEIKVGPSNYTRWHGDNCKQK
tara:strand:- start:1272 stop:1979 length:708 start_codon:yes stop_codon:yes gene_type:complete